jgi:hypothetical protein
MAFALDRSVFAGMAPTALQAALSSAQTALVNLQTGAQAVSLTYGEGNGTKHVTFQRTEIGGLVALIGELQACLGIARHARRGFRLSF